eukprot:1785468-Pyramimonas_sp.AAC.1
MSAISRNMHCKEQLLEQFNGLKEHLQRRSNVKRTPRTTLSWSPKPCSPLEARGGNGPVSKHEAAQRVHWQ